MFFVIKNSCNYKNKLYAYISKNFRNIVKMIQDDIKASKLDQRHLDGLMGSQSRNQNMWDLSQNKWV